MGCPLGNLSPYRRPGVRGGAVEYECEYEYAYDGMRWSPLGNLSPYRVPASCGGSVVRTRTRTQPGGRYSYSRWGGGFCRAVGQRGTCPRIAGGGAGGRGAVEYEYECEYAYAYDGMQSG